MSRRHVKEYPKEFREQVVKLASSSGRRPREIAEEFEISVDSVRCWVKLAKLDKCPRICRRFTVPALSLAGPFPPPIHPGRYLGLHPGDPPATPDPHAPRPHRSAALASSSLSPPESVHSP